MLLTHMSIWRLTYNWESLFALFGVIHLSKMIIASHEHAFISKSPTKEPLYCVLCIVYYVYRVYELLQNFSDTKIMLPRLLIFQI